jgi:hypothetical protein
MASNSYEIVTENKRKEEFKLELQRLLACYQLASHDDRRVVWAVLNKYAVDVD